MDVRVQVDVVQAGRWLDEIARQQIPFASARTLTRLAELGRATAGRGVRSRFEIRRANLIRTEDNRGAIKARPASKRDWPRQRSVVGLPDWAGFLIRHEKGGRFRAQGGHAMAVPTRVVTRKRTKTGKVPKRLRPRQVRERKGARVADTGGARTILAPVRRGGRMLAFHLLVPSINLRPRLRFERDVREEAKAQWSRILTTELEQAIRSRRVRAGSFTSEQGRAAWLSAGRRMAR